MRTVPTQRATDASQRSPAGGSRLGAASAGGDASQRNPIGPIGKVSLGTAVIGGDASQRSPPGLSNRNGELSFGFARLCCSPTQVAQNSRASWMIDRSQSLKPCEAQSGSLPESTCASFTAVSTAPLSTTQDAHQGHQNLAADGCSDALKSWLSGADGTSFSASDMLLAERLRAAAPESYED
jgi:hypothetical protein